NGTALQIPNINDGQVNEALLFEAAQAVAFSESAELEPGTGDFTAALWIRTLGKGNEILVTKGGLNQRSPGWAIVNTTTQTVVQVVLASGAMIRAPMPRIEPEIWAHVAFVVNRDMKSLRLYRDGKVVNVE